MPARRDTTLVSMHRDFITRGVSQIVSSSGAHRRPALSRACGCDVLEDGRLAIFIARSRSASLLEAISESRKVAAVFSEPSTHRTIQLKGDDAEIAEPVPTDLEVVERYCAAFAASLTSLGYPGPMALGLVRTRPDDLGCIVFSPTVVFDQTPGPDAGREISRVS